MYQRHYPPHPLAGKTVKLKANIGIGLHGEELGGSAFVVEDWADNVLGCSVWMAGGNPAALEYAMRAGLGNSSIPFDCKAVYGKIGAFGHIMRDYLRFAEAPDTDAATISPGAPDYLPAGDGLDDVRAALTNIREQVDALIVRLSPAG